MKDKAFLTWVYLKLKNVHGESIHVDYMYKLQAIIEATDPETITPNATVGSLNMDDYYNEN